LSPAYQTGFVDGFVLGVALCTLLVLAAAALWAAFSRRDDFSEEIYRAAQREKRGER